MVTKGKNINGLRLEGWMLPALFCLFLYDIN